MESGNRLLLSSEEKSMMVIRRGFPKLSFTRYIHVLSIKIGLLKFIFISVSLQNLCCTLQLVLVDDEEYIL